MTAKSTQTQPGMVNGNSKPPHFKPENSALILIDYQVGTMQLVKNQMPDTALRNAIKLARPRKRSKCLSS